MEIFQVWSGTRDISNEILFHCNLTEAKLNVYYCLRVQYKIELQRTERMSQRSCSAPESIATSVVSIYLYIIVRNCNKLNNWLSFV